MLAYFKNYKIAAYLISFLGPLVVIGIVLLATGVNLMNGIAGGVIWLVCMLALLFATSRYFGKKADEESERMLALYNQDCDPQAFQDEARKPATLIYEDCFAHGTTELGAWLLAPYALACADLDGAKDAEMMESALVDGIVEDTPAIERASILINIEPLTLRLHGAEAALSLALQAQALLTQKPDIDGGARSIANIDTAESEALTDADGVESTDDNTNAYASSDRYTNASSDAEFTSTDPAVTSLKSYLNYEIPLLQAMVEGDTDTLLQRFQRVRASETNPMRIRVLDADAEAAIYEAMGQPAAQRTALEFVVEHGNKLPVVAPAKARLARL